MGVASKVKIWNEILVPKIICPSYEGWEFFPDVLIKVNDSSVSDLAQLLTVNVEEEDREIVHLDNSDRLVVDTPWISATSNCYH